MVSEYSHSKILVRELPKLRLLGLKEPKPGPEVTGHCATALRHGSDFQRAGQTGQQRENGINFFVDASTISADDGSDGSKELNIVFYATSSLLTARC